MINARLRYMEDEIHEPYILKLFKYSFTSDATSDPVDWRLVARHQMSRLYVELPSGNDVSRRLCLYTIAF